MTISAFADRTLKWYDSPCPATDTGLSADNSHEPAGKGGEVCGSSSSLCTKCAAISNTLGMRPVLEASSTSAARGVSLSLLRKKRQTDHTLSPIHQPPGAVVVATANLHPGH